MYKLPYMEMYLCKQCWPDFSVFLYSPIVSTLELPSDQSFDKQISCHKKGDGVRGWGNGFDR